jgi:hypothetical protein
VKRQADGSIDKFKAQLVAQDFTQCPGFDFDNTYATIVCFDFLRLLIIITVVQGWHLQQVNVKSTFLYHDLKEEIYMTLPKGHRKKGKTA